MLIFLYGSDSYRRQKRASAIVEEYCKKYSGLSLDYFDLDPSINSRLRQDFGGQAGQEFLRLKEFSKQLSIFDNKKLAVLRNAFCVDIKDLREFLKKYLKEESATIFISENSLPQELKSVAAKAFLIDKFDDLKGDRWEFFVKKEAQQRQLNLSDQVLFFLANNFSGDSWGLINELDKICLACGKIEMSDYGSQAPDIFNFINAVVRNYPLQEKILELEKLFMANEEPVKVFNIMASLKWLPFNLIKKMADYDVMVKSGKIDYEEILLDLALI